MFPCANKTIHALLMTRFASLYLRDLGSKHHNRSKRKFTFANINKSYVDLDMVKTEQQATSVAKLLTLTLICELLLKAGQKNTIADMA